MLTDEQINESGLKGLERAIAYSNDAPNGEPVDLKAASARPQSAACLTVPHLRIWTVIDLRLKK
jgi:hypothetical protein